MLCHVAIVRTHVSEELCASIIRVAKIGELGTTLAVTKFTDSCHPDDGGAKFHETSVLKEPHGVISQKTACFIFFMCVQVLPGII
jgi:hypothetical protein